MYCHSFKFRFKYFMIGIGVTFVLGCIISSISITPGSFETCVCTTNRYEELDGSSHLLGVVIPFRDRFEELMEFAPHIKEFLNAQNVKHKIFVINQVDQYRFNRASLINVGFKIATAEHCDYIAMHDVDLLPLNPALSYVYPANGLFHIASPELHPKYHYPTFVGGILLVKKEDFILVNGMSNKYWGWGLEDDEFYVRLKEAGLNVTRPANLTTGVDSTFRHIHDRVRRKRDMSKCYNQREVTRRRDRQTGLRDLSYRIQSLKKLTIDGTHVTVVNTELRCNRSFTPWCLCSEDRKQNNGVPLKQPTALKVEKAS